MRSGVRIGIDFDNTIITYDEIFREAASRCGLIDDSFRGRKEAIRDQIRTLPQGELAWQRLQGRVYGKGIVGASMAEGVDLFLLRCRSEGFPVVIISHKTEYGHYDPDCVNLRMAALDWMKARKFFCRNGFDIPIDNVYFEGTRAEKLARIAALGCTHFIDDLEEVLTDPAFPPHVTRLLFSETARASPSMPYLVCPTWRRIEEHIFGHA
jgi:hypothetical protein